MRAAALQMRSGVEVGANLTDARRLIGGAAAAGAALVVLPENFALMPAGEGQRRQVAESLGGGPIQDFLADQARTLGIWIVGGTLSLRTGGDKVRSACLVYSPDGERVARYDKLHLFDVNLDNGEHYRESDFIEAGEVVGPVIETAIGRLAVTVCYDLRFPELFRTLAALQVDVFAVPSAFTAHTGRAHWDVLLKARAIENQAYVIGANQAGRHANGRETWGHSMIVNPWGQVLAVKDSEPPGWVLAEMDAQALATVRRALPSLTHRRIGEKVL